MVNSIGSVLIANAIQRTLWAPSNMSQMSTANRTSKEVQVMMGVASVSRNIASGNALQINGTVADNVYNFSM